MTRDLTALARFVEAMEAAVDAGMNEAGIVSVGLERLAELVSVDDWLPESHAAPDPAHYRQYLLHRDPQGRFSVVSFVWGPGQETPVHDHTVWGLIGVLRGAELSQRYVLSDGTLHACAPPARLDAGAVEAVSPTIGDIHKVSNALPDRPTISVHAYGADIGQVRRFTYDARGRAKTFVSGYSAAPPIDLEPYRIRVAT